MPSFWQLEAYFQGVNPAPSANSSQANWLSGAAEARQLAEELIRNVDILKQFWSGPAADSYYRAMQAIIDFAMSLSTDMTNMANGLSQMSMMASTIKPQALAIINAARSNPYSRAAAIAPLTALLHQLGGSYTSHRSSYWREPSRAPEQLPKAGNEQEAQPREGKEAGKVSPVDWLDRLQDLREIVETGRYIYDAFNPDDFPSGVIGDVPGNGGLPALPGLPGGPDGGNGGVPGWDGNGPLPDPDHPDYQPLPEPETELTDPNAPPETSLASAAPAGMVGPPPALSLATGGGPGMGGGMGAVPMAGMGMGMGGAAGAAKAAPASASGGGRPMGGGMMGPGMMGGMRGGQQKEEESGHRTWLTEDEMAWDGDAAPSGVVGGLPTTG